MGWVLLFSAGLAEIIFAISLKYNMGFTKLYPSIVTAISGGASFYLLMLAIKTLPLGTAYAIWTGMGAVGVAVLSIFLFKESTDWFRLVSIGLIVLGIVGLKVTHRDEIEDVSHHESVKKQMAGWQFDWRKRQLAKLDKTSEAMGWRQSDALCFDIAMNSSFSHVPVFNVNMIETVNVWVEKKPSSFNFNHLGLNSVQKGSGLLSDNMDAMRISSTIWSDAGGKIYQFSSNNAYWRGSL